MNINRKIYLTIFGYIMLLVIFNNIDINNVNNLNILNNVKLDNIENNSENNIEKKDVKKEKINKNKYIKFEYKFIQNFKYIISFENLISKFNNRYLE